MLSLRLVRPILAAAGLGLAAGCGRPPVPGAASPTLPPMPATVTPVRAAELSPLLEVTGTVRPLRRALLAAKAMGTLAEFPVVLGQRVRAGDVLARIAAEELEARLAQARSGLNQLQRDLARERGLLAKGASTADVVRSLEDRLVGAQAQVAEAEVFAGYATLRAPFDGVVARKLAEAGDLASPGLPLLELGSAAEFQIEVALPATLAAPLAVGTALPVTLPASGLRFSATVAELSSAADAAARSVLARLDVPAGTAVRAGDFVRLEVPAAPVRTLLVPATAVSSFGQMERVFVVTADGRAGLRLVRTGARRGAELEILAGLDAGERIVAAPAPTLRDGQPLEIRP
jgi:RND family efflux transporter MFP subunit